MPGRALLMTSTPSGPATTRLPRLPILLHKALATAGVTHGEFADALAAGMAERDRFTSFAAPHPRIGAARTRRLPPMTARRTGDWVQGTLWLGTTGHAEMDSDLTTIFVRGTDLPETIRLAAEGKPINKVVDHPLLAEVEAPIAVIARDVPGELRISFREPAPQA